MITNKLSAKEFQVVEEVITTHNIDDLIFQRDSLIERRDSAISRINKQIDDLDSLISEAQTLSIF